MEKWNRFRYLPVLPLGEEGRLVTGSKEHIRLSRAAAGEGITPPGVRMKYNKG